MFLSLSRTHVFFSPLLFSRVYAVKHVNVYAMSVHNVLPIHVGSDRLVSILLIWIMFVFVHPIIRAKIVERSFRVKRILVRMVEHVFRRVG